MGFFRYIEKKIGFGMCMGIENTAAEVYNQKSIAMQQFEKKYMLTDKVLGKGGFSIVKEAHGNECNYRKDLSYAVKIIDQESLSKKSKSRLQQEIEILQMMDHPNIIKLYGSYDVCSHVYLVTEIMSGGELFDKIVRKKYYNESEARDVCKVLLEAVAYCHEHKIAHRDLKPANLLLKSNDSDLEIKIADFGFAKIAETDHSLLSQCGTPQYVSPELVSGIPYGTKTDMWSVGVIMYILLSGYQPFRSKDESLMYDLILKGKYKFHDKYWSVISDDAKDLISRLLTVNPSRRISASDALKSKWIKNDGLEANDLCDNLEEFKKFNARRKLKGAALATIATLRLRNSLTM